MKTTARALAIALAVGACFAPGVASAFTSPSTGADGPFSPTVNTTVALPPSGIFNYTSVNIPAGVTVTFLKNTTNTPIVILATGDVTIAGIIDVRGASSANVGAAGDGALGDDGTPGVGGPGGFDGGRGGVVGGTTSFGGTGLGPGGGQGGLFGTTNNFCTTGAPLGGAGGGFGAAGSNSPSSSCPTPAVGGSAYGSSQILPLIGGSGGGGGAGGTALPGSGGGGGGGALLIAASGTVNVTGTINASGGASGSTSTTGNGGTGGGGSGGGLRIIATTLTGNGTISAAAGVAASLDSTQTGGNGAAGRIRFEAETFNRTAASTPTASISTPGPVFVTGAPALAISSVAGVSAPANPTGNADITLASSTPNPVTVVFTTSGVPVGNTVQLTVTPAFGAKTTVVSPALTGSTASATASVSVNLAVGPSVLQAQTTYTIVASLGDLLKNFAGNERVERIALSATFGGRTKATLITVSGKEYEAPAEALQIAALGG